MADAQDDTTPTLTVRDVIIIASVCAVIIITLLIILVCFICQRRRRNAKNPTHTLPPSASNGGLDKKMAQGPSQSQQSYDNADGRYPTFASSSEHPEHPELPPNYWDSNPDEEEQRYHPGHNLSFDSHADRQLYEMEVNRRNDLAIYGRADGYRGQQESIHMQGRPMSPNKDRYLDLEDRKDPSLQSQESGYSTGDPNKPKKKSSHLTFSFGFGWRPPRPFSVRRRNLSRMRKKQKKSQPHQRFSHSPPGHTCGLPCCSEEVQLVTARGLQGAPSSRYSCMPVPHRQGELENNFTFRRSQLLAGKPSLSHKFFSLQDKSGKGRRAGLPRFQDDWGIIAEGLEEEEEEEGGKSRGGEDSNRRSASSATKAAADAARESLLRYRASIETDTDGGGSGSGGGGASGGGGGPQPYLEDGVSINIRIPVRHLRPWECFHRRQITLPDLPATPRRMVFLDHRPGESHDGGGDAGVVEEDERIEVYSSGFKPLSSSSSSSSHTYTRPASTTATTSTRSSSSPSSSTSPTHSSSSASTTTTSTATAAMHGGGRGTKVTYSGAVRPLVAPAPQLPLKSALKKRKTSDADAASDAAPATNTNSNTSSNANAKTNTNRDLGNKCPTCQSKAREEEEFEKQTVDVKNQSAAENQRGDKPTDEPKNQGELKNQGEVQNQSQGRRSQGRRVHLQLPDIPKSASSRNVGGGGEGTGISKTTTTTGTPSPLAEDSDAYLLYDSHVYDVLSDVITPRDGGGGDNTSEEKGKDDNDDKTDVDRDSTKPQHKYDRVGDITLPPPPPVPPTRLHHDPPCPQRGRKALTPELTRRNMLHRAGRTSSVNTSSSTRVGGGEKTEERYSTFPTRRRHHDYEELTPSGDKSLSIPGVRNRHRGGTGKVLSSSALKLNLQKAGLNVPPSGNTSDDLLVKSSSQEDYLYSEEDNGGGHRSRSCNSSSALDIYALDDTHKLLDKEEQEDEEDVAESLYEALNPAFLSDNWSLTKNKGGGSLGSLDSERLSHVSFGSFGCTCLSLDQLSLRDVSKGDDVRKDSDVTAGGDEGEKKLEGKVSSGFLADNPITLIL